MVAINFKKHFAILVEKGIKRQTIRENTKASSGKLLQLYYGQRTKQCRKLMDAVCKSTRSVILRQNQAATTSGAISDLNAFARKDGFKDYEEMWNFFEPRADECGEFHGWLIEW
jgi:hypothetical protein